MKLLLDTHILIWALQDDAKLPTLVRQLLTNGANRVFYSAASPWEVQIKHASHPDLMITDAENFVRLCDQAGYETLPITNTAVLQLDTLSRTAKSHPHNDPFDRIMICQAKAGGFTFLTHDSALNDYNEPCVLCV